MGNLVAGGDSQAGSAGAGRPGERQTRRDGQRTDDQTLIMDDMKMV